MLKGLLLKSGEEVIFCKYIPCDLPYSLFRFVLEAGGCVSWPTGRGIFLSSDRQLIVWVNEEDHLRVISLKKGGDLSSVYSR